MRISPIRPGLNFYVEKLARGENFSFSRYNDGELLCMLGASGHNRDKHEYFPALGEALRRAVRNNRGYMALGVLAKKNDDMVALLRELNPAINWHWAEVWRKAITEEKFRPFIDVIRRRRVVYVGPDHLRGLHPWAFEIAEFVDVPLVNCWLEVGRIERDIWEVVQPGDVVMFSAGMPTCVLIDQLYLALGSMVSLIDMGSAFDIFVGVKSRSGHTGEKASRYDWPRLIRHATLGGGEFAPSSTFGAVE